MVDVPGALRLETTSVRGCHLRPGMLTDHRPEKQLHWSDLASEGRGVDAAAAERPVVDHARNAAALTAAVGRGTAVKA